MPNLDEFCYDVASGLSLGCRDRQEDAVIADFALGAPFGFAVLSDGMGGHAAGDVASGIVVTEVFSELKMQSENPTLLEQEVGDVLRSAVEGANRCMYLYGETNAEARGMGATLVVPVLFANRLYWISVGDSPFFLFRDGRLLRLNEDHSYAAQVDEMRAQGVLEYDSSMAEPDQNCLVSVLAGGDIARIDCRTDPVTLFEGDILIAASDGVHTLDENEIAALITRHQGHSSNEIGLALLEAVEDQNCPEQDNLSFCVIKVMKRATIRADHRVLSQPEMIAPKTSGEKTADVVRINRTADNGTVRTLFCVSRKVNRQ